MAAARTDIGRHRGARSRSPIGSGSSIPTMTRQLSGRLARRAIYQALSRSPGAGGTAPRVERPACAPCSGAARAEGSPPLVAARSVVGPDIMIKRAARRGREPAAIPRTTGKATSSIGLDSSAIALLRGRTHHPIHDAAPPAPHGTRTWRELRVQVNGPALAPGHRRRSRCGMRSLRRSAALPESRFVGH